MEIYVASAFSKENSGGNKAGVVFDECSLTTEQKLKAAKELGYSETAFVTESAAADFKLEYFTPTREVSLCGHATIAAFSVLRLLDRLDKKDYVIETKAGLLDILVKEGGLILMQQKLPKYLGVLRPEIFANCIETQVIDSNFPIQIVSTGLKDIMLPVASARLLRHLKPRLEELARLCEENNAVGVHAFALTNERGITAICRNFAPLYGIDEEPATGTSNCALACYLFRHHEKKTRYVFEQGYNLGEASQLIVYVKYHGDVIESVFVGGYGRLLCKKALSV